MTDDEITAAAIEQAQELPEPTAEQAHDAVAIAIQSCVADHWHRRNGLTGSPALLHIRALEHATRLLRRSDGEIARLRIALSFYAEENNWRNDVVGTQVFKRETPDSSVCARDAGGMARKALED